MTEGEYQAFMSGWLAAIRTVSERVTATLPPYEREAATEFSKFQEKCRRAALSPTAPLTNHIGDANDMIASDAEARADSVTILRTKMIAALEGLTKHSRDTRLSGEYLTGLVWPLVSTALSATPSPSATPVSEAEIEAAGKVLINAPEIGDWLQQTFGSEWPSIQKAREFGRLAITAAASVRSNAKVKA